MEMELVTEAATKGDVQALRAAIASLPELKRSDLLGPVLHSTICLRGKCNLVSNTICNTHLRCFKVTTLSLYTFPRPLQQSQNPSLDTLLIRLEPLTYPCYL